nr:MAG: replication associated protein [Cressdnaviricota sp.]
MSSVKSRAYCFTLNNYSDADYESILSVDCRYIVVGKEIGESGTPHLQGFIYFDNPRAFNAVKKIIPKAHLEAMKGTAIQASDYCKKDGQFVERGECPNQGKRSDIDDIRELIKTKPKMREVIDVANSIQSVKMAEQILKYKEKARDFLPEVYWFYGETGTGKSRAVSELIDPEDSYYCLGTIKWFDGYDAHSDVVIDDIRSNFSTYSEFLRLIDRYPYKVEIKGSTRQFLAKRIFITSPYHPRMLWQNVEDKTQLLRRIKEIRKFGEEEVNFEIV